LLALAIVLLVAAAVDSRVPGESVEAEIAALVETDSVVVTLAPPPERPITSEVVCVPQRAVIPPAGPALSRVFRPPRSDSSS
ncbi:MAG: hypothetical protein H6Q90_6351, partial [Deltaproteobacteria bacterium]|nr:hypothetical protein [Deltaproteobacteria bacterium]